MTSRHITSVTPYLWVFCSLCVCGGGTSTAPLCPPPRRSSLFPRETPRPDASACGCCSGPGCRVHLLGNRGGKWKLLIQDHFLQSVGCLGSTEQSIRDRLALAPVHVLPFQPVVVSVLGNRWQDGVGLDLRTHLLRGCHWGNEKARQLQTAPSEG